MKYKVLVVDDAPSIRKALKMVLARADCYMLEASNVPEAIGEVLKHPDTKLVVVDYQMPDMNGIEFVETLLQMSEIAFKPKVLMISGVATQEQRLQALAAGADAFLPKPFNTVQFEDAVRDLGILAG